MVTGTAVISTSIVVSATGAAAAVAAVVVAVVVVVVVVVVVAAAAAAAAVVVAETVELCEAVSSKHRATQLRDCFADRISEADNAIALDSLSVGPFVSAISGTG